MGREVCLSLSVSLYEPGGPARVWGHTSAADIMPSRGGAGGTSIPSCVLPPALRARERERGVWGHTSAADIMPSRGSLYEPDVVAVDTALHVRVTAGYHLPLDLCNRCHLPPPEDGMGREVRGSLSLSLSLSVSLSLTLALSLPLSLFLSLSLTLCLSLARSLALSRSR